MACPKCGAASVSAGQPCPACGAGAVALPDLDLPRRPSGAKVPAAPAAQATGGREVDFGDTGGGGPDIGLSRGGALGAFGGASSGGHTFDDDDDLSAGPALELAALPSSQKSLPSSQPAGPGGPLPASSGSLPAAPVSSGSLPAPVSSNSLPAGPRTSGVPHAPSRPAAPVPAAPPPDDPAARLAGYGPPPKQFWETPMYAYRVLMRQRELKAEAANALASRAPEAPLYQAALHAHDQKAVTMGIALVVGAFVTLTLVFFSPVIVRFVRLAMD